MPLLRRSSFIREDLETEARFGATPVPGKIGMAMAGQGLDAALPPCPASHNYLGTQANPGNQLYVGNTFDINFKNVEKQFESYRGINVKLRCVLHTGVDITADGGRLEGARPMGALLPAPADTNTTIKMEVGIKDCLHIEFEYNKSKYHLKNVVVGKIYFLLVCIKIKHMELSIIRRETTGSPPNQCNESETIMKFEVMDGAPVRGETIPIRLFLRGFDLTPTFRDINKKFSTRYYLNLVLINEENRRYFKQQVRAFLCPPIHSHHTPFPPPASPSHPSLTVPSTFPRS
ncbi:putative PEP8-vacuolar protein sorting/targeting protein [Mycena vulgaris]|nr:putative PEP8-vacuolar protein sorting/targeting protein [Mycena vulgaris]